MASESSITTSGYIKHHLQNLTYGEKQVETATGIWESTGELGFATTGQEAAQMGFWAINVDTMLLSIVLGTLMMWFFRINTFCYEGQHPPIETQVITTVLEDEGQKPL